MVTRATVARSSAPAPATRGTAKAAATSGATQPAARIALVRSAPQPPVRKLVVMPPPAPVAAAAPSPTAVENPFLSLLQAKRCELRGNLEDTKFDTLAKMGRVAEDDQAQMSHEEFISVQRNSMDYHSLRLVNAAIERVNSGDYGVCASCEEPISEKRLKAIPWAKYCVVCQDRVQANGGIDDTNNEDASSDSW